jgi:peptidoglycan/LPS O-acetylase OafA/YrhL
VKLTHNHSRLYPLDLLRFLAALCILFYHFGFFGPSRGLIQHAEAPYFFQWSRYCYWGVPFFFMISGYVISMSAASQTAIQFLSRRFLRLFPAYWLACTITYLTIHFFGYPPFGVYFQFYLVNMSMLQSFFGFGDMDGSYWTLALELQFYAMIFLCCLSGRFHYYRYLLLLWLGISLYYMPGPPERFDNLPFMAVWSGFFIAGSCFYLLQQNKKDILAYVMLAGSFLLCWHSAGMQATHYTNLHNTLFDVRIMRGMLALFFGIFWVLITYPCKSLQRPFFYQLGMLSYPLFLLHQTLGYFVIHYFFPNHFGYPQLLLVMLFFAGLIPVFYYGLEKPFTRFLRQRLAKLL